MSVLDHKIEYGGHTIPAQTLTSLTKTLGREFPSTMSFVRFVLIATLMNLCAIGATAQVSSAVKSDYDMGTLAGDTVKVGFGKRFSFHFNALDYALAMPSLGVEFDLSPYRRGNMSVVLSSRFNPGTSNSRPLRLVYNITTFKGEFRKYWRTSHGKKDAKDDTSPYDYTQRDEVVPDTTLWFVPRTFHYLRRRYLSGRYVDKPRYWRAYYIGAFAAYDKFSFEFKGPGVQGTSLMAGVSAGWSIPLYRFGNKSAWDLDIGASAGLAFTKLDKYEYYLEGACYVRTSSEDWRILPYPMLHDIHISLVYRLRSIEYKVQYGPERFTINEERLDSLRKKRQEAINAKREQKEREVFSKDIYGAIDLAKQQLELYKADTLSASYVILSEAVMICEKGMADIMEGRLDKDSELTRDLLKRELEYYMFAAMRRSPSAAVVGESAASGKKGKKAKKDKKKRNEPEVNTVEIQPEPEAPAEESQPEAEAPAEEPQPEAEVPAEESQPEAEAPAEETQQEAEAPAEEGKEEPEQ